MGIVVHPTRLRIWISVSIIVGLVSSIVALITAVPLKTALPHANEPKRNHILSNEECESLCDKYASGKSIKKVSLDVMGAPLCATIIEDYRLTQLGVVELPRNMLALRIIVHKQYEIEMFDTLKAGGVPLAAVVIRKPYALQLKSCETEKGSDSGG